MVGLIEVEEAVQTLIAGGVVGIPTETVYGLSADGLSAQSVARLFAVKDRPADNPLILHVADLSAALPLWSLTPRDQRRVERLASLWPGPMTVVLPAADHVPAIVTAGLRTVAVRVPNHPVTQRILRGVGRPLAAPSANRSGRPSPTTAMHVLDDLADAIDGVVDGGPCSVGVESTVVDLYSEVPRILRPGAIGQDALSDVLGEAVTAYAADPTAGSPGLRHRHYRPTIDRVVRLVDASEAWRSSDALLLFASTAGRLVSEYGIRTAPTEVLPDDPAGAMRALYGCLRRCEGLSVDTLQVELPPREGVWEALHDRLVRAVGDVYGHPS